MAIIAYSKYRLYLTANAGGTAGYFTINEFGLYEDGDHTGVNLCTGATATAHSAYSGSTGAANAIDGNATTYWESNSTTGPKWLRVDLAAPKQVRSLYLSATQYPAEVPRNFIFQGSNDGTTWTDIAAVVDWVTNSTSPKSAYEQLNLRIGGTSMLETGGSATRVLLYQWDTGALVTTLTPNSAGEWSYSPRSKYEFLVTHIGPSGFQPWSDGPVTPNTE